MRLQEFVNAEDQIRLWKLICDSMWEGLKLQWIEQQRRRLDSPKRAPKAAARTTASKKTKSVTSPKQPKTPKKQVKATKPLKQPKQPTVQFQTQKPQVLPKVFSNTQKSNLATPQQQTTSSTSQFPQSLAKTRSERLTHDPNSVANIQRQLYPLANNDVVKRLTN